MRTVLSRLWFLVVLCAAWQSAAAWQVELRAEEDSTAPSRIWVSNAQARANVKVYLVWADLDSGQAHSWQPGGTWRAGVAPLAEEALDVPALPATPVGELPFACPAQDRCFLALVATPPDADPLNAEEWQSASLLPLSVAASRERLPGQTVFSSVAQNTGSIFSGAPEATDALDGDTGAPATEKPDIFRLEGNQLWYANAQARRFQIIDVQDPAQPALQASAKLSGTPLEVYHLYGYSVVLQGVYDSAQEEGTQVTVFAQDADGQLRSVGESLLPGHFVQSRRRGDVIYSVSQSITTQTDGFTVTGGGSDLLINALRVTPEGQVDILQKTSLPGYDPHVAIFPDHLVIANLNPLTWNSSVVQVYDLGQAGQPLTALSPLEVPGYIPSEFHLDVRDGQLRLVYGPWGWGSGGSPGSTLAVYDLSGPKLALVGRVGGIAPGESLFATRFVGDRAFVVTYLQKDPLWVIDLSDPAKPAVLGELEVPGWSEKLFFHDDRLFAVGIDDQPAPGEDLIWARRVAVSLFDVGQPTLPKLLGRFTPLVGEANYSHSLALNDERALLLDWDNSFAALPLESWGWGWSWGNGGNYLQLVSFAQDKPVDAGRLEVNTPVLRSLELGPDLLGVLGEDAFLTVRENNGKPAVLGELELAANTTWLRAGDGRVWAAVRGNQGYYRLDRYAPSDLETPQQRWKLPRSYGGVLMDGDLAVFYSYEYVYDPQAAQGAYRLVIQVVELDTGKLWPMQQLGDLMAYPTWGDIFSGWSPVYSFGAPMLHDGRLYLTDFRNAYLKEQAETVGVQELRTWKLAESGPSEEAPRLLPGAAVAITQDGKLITSEYVNRQTRLDLLALEPGQARLLHSLSLDCTTYNLILSDATLYVMCNNWTSMNGLFPSNWEGHILQVQVGDKLRLVKRTALSEPRLLLAAKDDVALIQPGYYYYYSYDTVGLSNPIPPCEIVRLGDTPTVLKTLDTCPGTPEGVALEIDHAYLALGYDGIEKVAW